MIATAVKADLAATAGPSAVRKTSEQSSRSPWIGVVAAIMFGPAIAGPNADAAEKFQKLTGAQITARFAGMEMSDDVHWRDRYERNGTITSTSMGKNRSGTWRVEKNELCIDFSKDQGGCYEVWLAGKKVEFRRQGFDGSIQEGTLQNPIGRR